MSQAPRQRESTRTPSCYERSTAQVLPRDRARNMLRSLVCTNFRVARTSHGCPRPNSRLTEYPMDQNDRRRPSSAFAQPVFFLHRPLFITLACWRGGSKPAATGPQETGLIRVQRKGVQDAQNLGISLAAGEAKIERVLTRCPGRGPGGGALREAPAPGARGASNRRPLDLKAIRSPERIRGGHRDRKSVV